MGRPAKLRSSWLKCIQCYRAGMKSCNRLQAPVIKPILKELDKRHKADLKKQTQTPSIGKKPLDPPALYEDAGEGYNANFTFPQD